MIIKGARGKKSLQRSFIIDAGLVAEVQRLVPRELSDNLNRIVTVALQELAKKLKHDRFEAAMARMAVDPALRRQSTGLERAFRRTEADGL